MASTRGRQVVEPLVNKSGGSVAAGDVVIIDTTNDGAFTTTTTSRSEVTVGIAQETIANNATGRILLSGYAALVNVPASVTRGHYIETYTVVKQATGSSTRRSGSFGQFRTGGTTPTAVLWGSTDQTASGGTAITTSTNQLAADVTMTSANTYYDGPSLSGLNGTYLLIGVVSLDGNNASISHTAKLWNGTTVLASAETLTYGGAAGRKYSSLTLIGVRTTSGSETWKVSAAGDGAGGKILAAAPDNGAGNNASTLVAVKIG